MNTNRLDFILFPLLLCIFCVSLYSLLSDQIANSSSKVDSIAQVIGMNNTVKTKKSFNYHWVNTRSGEGLGEDDQIFTYSNSTAEIKLNSGAKISVTPNSLISLKSQGEQTGINIKNGLILADLNDSREKIKIDLGGKEIELSSKNAQLQITKQDGKSKIEIIKGEVSFNNQGSTVSLKKGQLLSKENDKINIDKSPITLIHPKNSSILREQDLINFKWESDLKTEDTRLIISKSTNFKKSKTLNTNSIQLKPGTYYWKVSSKEKESGLRMFRILPQLTTFLKRPLAEEILILNKDIKVVHFSWNDSYFNNFDFELLGPQKIERTNLNSSFTSASLSKTGSYKWRIRPKDQEWTNFQEFEISPPFLPNAPTINSPKSNEIITLFDKTKSSFRWTGEKSAQYLIQVSKDEQFTEIAFEQRMANNQLEWAPRVSGQYFFRVRQLDLLSRETAFSKSRTFKIDLVDNSNFIPKTGSKIVLSRPKEKVTFKWKESKTFNKARPKYYLEISDSQQFDNIIISEETFSNNSSVTFPKIGQYYWRTKVIYPNQKESFSSPQRVTITPTPPPTRPVIKDLDIEIKVNSILERAKQFLKDILNVIIPSVSASELNTSAEISWEAVENSKSYILEIYKDIQLREKLLSTALETNSYTLNAVKEGTYYWRIATVDHWDRQSEFSALSRITLTLPEYYKEVPSAKLLRPRNNFLAKGARATINFKWGSPQKNLKYSLLISKNEDFNKLYVKRTIDTNVYAIRLSKGIYYWKVIAKNQFGYESESATNTFVIKENQVSKKISKTKQTTNKKIKTSKRNDIPTSNFSLEYGVLSSSFEQTYSTYSINADGIVFSSFEINNLHYFNFSNSIETSLKRFTGKVYNDLSYGVFSIQSMYGYTLSNNRLRLSIGVSLNNYTSYKRVSNNIQEEKSSSIGIPASLDFRYKLFSLKNESSLSYSLGDLSCLEVFQRLYLNKVLSLGLGYESYLSKKDSSEIKMTNIKTAIRYQINY